MDDKQQKTVFITGATGMDGSILSDLYLQKGYKVIGMKRRTSLLNSSKRIDHIFNHPNFKLVYGNMSDASSLWRLLFEYRPDIIINTAAMSHVRTSFDVSEETLDVVAMGPLRLLNAMKEICPNSKFYNCASSEQFGISKCPETGYVEDSPMIPASPYGCSKLFAYNITRNYRNSYGLYATSGILFNHEEPGTRGETFVTRKVTIAASKIKLGLQKKLLLGNLDAYRDWGRAKDYCEGIILMLQQDKPDDYILATNETHTVREMCEYVFDLAGLDYKKFVEIDPRLYRPQEVPYLKGDSTKARTVLKWQPKHTFYDLLREMYEYDLKEISKENDIILKYP